MEQQPGIYNYTPWEYTMQTIHANDMGIISILNPNNPLYDNGTEVHTKKGVAAMARWAGALAKHFRDAKVGGGGRSWWEVVNEPNSPGSYYENATLYAELVAAVAAEVHKAVPDAQIVGPASENIGLTSGWLLDIFEAGALRHFDVVTIHPYRSDGPETVEAE